MWGGGGVVAVRLGMEWRARRRGCCSGLLVEMWRCGRLLRRGVRGASDESDGAVYEHEEEEAGDDEDEADAGAVAAPTANSTRSKARQRKKA